MKLIGPLEYISATSRLSSVQLPMKLADLLGTRGLIDQNPRDVVKEHSM